MDTRTKTTQMLSVLQVVAWIGFIGLMIEGGSILFAYGVSWFNPDFSKQLYNGGLRSDLITNVDFFHYSISVSYLFALACMKAYVAYLIIKILSKVSLVNPFTSEIATTIEKISHVLIGLAIIGVLSNSHDAWLSKFISVSHNQFKIGEYVFMAAIVFVIAQIFKRGVEIQSENDLTV